MLEGRWLICVILVQLLFLDVDFQSSAKFAVAQATVMPQALVSSEAYAMRHLRYTLKIRNFYWPKSRDPCLYWRGVFCEGGHVVTIYLSGLKRTLGGMSDPSFAVDNLRGLPFLRTLNASGFVMLGSIPDWFGQMSSLQVLDLSSCSINGSVPDSFGELQNLERLSLSNNNLTGEIPSSLTDLRNLMFVDMSANSLTGPIPDSMGHLSQLQQLDLSHNTLNGFLPQTIGQVSALSYVDLSNNELTGSIPRDLGNLKKLKTLRLSNNLFNGNVPEEIGGCSNLEDMELRNNSLNGSLPSSLGSLKNMTILNLSFNRLTGILPAGISNFSNPAKLLLSQNFFYGPLPQGLKNLSALDVSNNYLNGSLPADISGASVSGNCFSDASGQREFNVCQAFYAQLGLIFSGNESSPLDKPTPMMTDGGHGKHRRLGLILGGVFGGLAFILLIAGFVLIVLKHERRTGNKNTETTGATTPSTEQQQQQQQQQQQYQQQQFPVQTIPAVPGIAVKMSSIGEPFTYAQLQRITQNFSSSNLLKSGHSGDLYRGVLDGGALVVVKRIEVSKMRRDLLSSELEVFGKASHTRLVPLLGHCLDNEDYKFLVYKYMPNGDLSQALHKKSIPSPPADILQSLDWITRLKIATGAAEGLAYLHHECSPPLVHRDIQASSILLDDKFEVRLGSLSETRTQEGDSHPGLITRILRLSQTTEHGEQGSAIASCAYDVYCFGKVLLELVSGKLDISGSSDQSADAWLEWALPLIDRHDKEALMKLVDPSLIVDEDLLEEVWAMAIVAKLCLNQKPQKRPQIRHILKALENPQRVTREENFNSSLRSRNSSHSSWNASLFGSWRHSSSENVLREDYGVEQQQYHQQHFQHHHQQQQQQLQQQQQQLQQQQQHQHSSIISINSNSNNNNNNNNNRKQSSHSHSQGGSIVGVGESFHRRAGSNEIFPEPAEEIIQVKPSSLLGSEN